MVAVSLAVAATLPGDALLYAVLPVVWAELGLELWMVGVLLGANRAVRLATNPWAGALVVRRGIHGPFTAAVFATAGVTAAYAVAPGFAALLALRLVWGALWSFLRLGGFLAALSAGDMGRGQALGFYNGIANLGTLLAMATGGLLTDAFGFRATMVGFALLALPAGLAMWREGPGPEDEARETAAEAPAEWPGALRRWAVYGGALVTGMAGSPLVLATLGLRLVEVHGEQIAIGGALLGAATLNGALLGVRFALQPVWAPLAGRLSDRFGRRPFAALVGGVCAASLLALSVQEQLAGTVVVAVFLFLSGAALRVSCDAMAGDAAPASGRARFMGWYSNAADLGTAVGPLLAYPLVEAIGLGAVYRLGAAFLTLGGAAVLLAHRRSERTH